MSIGFLRAPIGYEVVRSLYGRLGSYDAATARDLLEAMAEEALAVVEPGRFGAPVRATRTAFMRYVGQGHEIAVRLSDGPLDAGAMKAEFDAEYARFYDRPVPGSDVEVLSYAVKLETVLADAVRDETASPAAQDAVAPRALVVRDPVSTVTATWAVYDRAALPPGATLHGPAIIAEDETSTLVGAGWSASIGADSTIILTRELAA